MKKYLILSFVLLATCGGSQNSTDEVESNSNNIDTTTTIQDTTTTTIIKNKCEDCEYVSIEELSVNINNVPMFAWNDYQRISNENIKWGELSLLP